MPIFPTHKTQNFLPVENRTIVGANNFSPLQDNIIAKPICDPNGIHYAKTSDVFLKHPMSGKYL
jgi:hypothetical protein